MARSRSLPVPDAGADCDASIVDVRVFNPCEPLSGYVTFFYVVEVSAPLKDFLYPEWGNVRFAISGDWMVRMPGQYSTAPQTAALFGPTDRHGSIETSGGKVVGFGLTPIGWHRLIGGDAAALANRVVPLENELGVEAGPLHWELIEEAGGEKSIARLEQVLQARMAQRPAVSPAVLAIDRALRLRPDRVTDFATEAGLGVRTLERLCLRTFGFPPKRLMRLQRFLDTLGRVRTAVGQSIEMGIGDQYYDQPHFYHDFKEFMAMTPREYYGSPRRLMAAAAEAQIRAGVTLSFRLPPPPAGSSVGAGFPADPHIRSSDRSTDQTSAGRG